MGRLLIIMVLVVIVTTSLILHSNYSKYGEVVPELMENYHTKQARNLASYALDFGIQKITQEEISVESLPNSTPYEFEVNEAVSNGTINAIHYQAMNAEKDTIKVTAFVTWSGDEVELDYQSSAIFEAIPANPGIPGDFFERGVVTVGGIKIRSARARIIGGSEEYADFSFFDIFGITLEEFKSLARITSGRNPVFTGGLYYHDDNLHHAGSPRDMGTGIVVVNGDIHLTAHTQFKGILIGLGECDTITPGTQFLGTYIGLGTDGSGDSIFMRGNAVIEYNLITIRNFINSLLAANGLTLGSLDGPGVGSSEASYRLVKWIQ